MTDEQRNPGEERRQPFAADSMAGRMHAVIRRCVDMTGYRTGTLATARTSEEDEGAEPTDPPCSCP